MGPGLFFAATPEILLSASAGPEQPHGLQEATAPVQRPSECPATAAAGGQPGLP